MGKEYGSSFPLEKEIFRGVQTANYIVIALMSLTMKF